MSLETLPMIAYLEISRYAELAVSQFASECDRAYIDRPCLKCINLMHCGQLYTKWENVVFRRCSCKDGTVANLFFLEIRLHYGPHCCSFSKEFYERNFSHLYILNQVHRPLKVCLTCLNISFYDGHVNCIQNMLLSCSTK